MHAALAGLRSLVLGPRQQPLYLSVDIQGQRSCEAEEGLQGIPLL